MRSLPAVGLLLVLMGAPTCAAWAAQISIPPAEVSLRESLLVAGSIEADSDDGYFGAPAADRLTFDAPAIIVVCPDQAGQPAPQQQSCPGSETSQGARLYVHAGGLVLRPEPGALISLRSAATAAALGGPNVTIGEEVIGAGVYTGGDSVVTASASALRLRPIGTSASLEVRGEQGFRVYNGSAYTMYISNVSEARLEARGAFVTGPAIEVRVSRAPLARAENGIRVEALFDALRAVQPPERADRRADLAAAFGPFQTVPALLNGAAAARENLTLNGELRDEFTLLRMEDLRLGHDGTNWTGTGNATYLVEGEILSPAPAENVGFPVLLPIALVLGAFAARAFTPREPARKSRRVLAHVVRLAGLVALAFLAAAALSPLLGFSPLLDARALALRSRVQLALLVVGMVAASWISIGIASESLARSAFAWRERPKAMVLPAAAGVVATMLFLIAAAPILLSVVARFVRL